MAKPEKKSIADLISKKNLPRKPSSAEIEQITSKIHQAEQAKGKEQPVPATEKTKRISVNAPVTLYLQAKTRATLQDQTLMAYIMRLIEADVR